MGTIAAFGDSVLKGVIYEDEHYRVTDSSFQKICEQSFGITIENKARFGSTIAKGESVFEKNLSFISGTDGEYVVLEFGGNDCNFNWKEVSEDPERHHLPSSTIANKRPILFFVISANFFEPLLSKRKFIALLIPSITGCTLDMQFPDNAGLSSTK